MDTANEMTEVTPDYGALHYIELIKSNLKFVYGRNTPLDIITQLKAPDYWKVTAVKTKDGRRNVALFECGVGLFKVLESMHRMSAELVSKYTAEIRREGNGDETREQQIEAVAAKIKADEESKAKKVKEAADAADAADAAAKAVVVAPQESEKSDSDNSDAPAPKPSIRNRIFVNWPRRQSQDVSQDVVSIKSDSSLRSRSLICPNYGPASAFYRVPSSSTGVSPERFQEMSEELCAEAAANLGVVRKPGRAPGSLLARLAAPSIVNAEVKALSGGTYIDENGHKSTPFTRLQWENYKHKSRVPESPRNVLLFIQWPGYGEVVVADECQLNVRAVQNRVRHMIRAHGAILFGDARKLPRLPFKPDEGHNFTVTVTSMNLNERLVMLGPGFVEDLEVVANGMDQCETIKINVELKWNGKPLEKGI